MEELRLVAGALLTGFGALGAGIGIGTLTSKRLLTPYCVLIYNMYSSTNAICICVGCTKEA